MLTWQGKLSCQVDIEKRGCGHGEINYRAKSTSKMWMLIWRDRLSRHVDLVKSGC